jgi:hypothetical protein
MKIATLTAGNIKEAGTFAGVEAVLSLCVTSYILVMTLKPG